MLSYQDTKVLDNITTTIKNSGITSIIGPNGAGKSTLLSIIGRLLMADSGHVKVNELDVVKTPSDKLATYLSVLRDPNFKQMIEKYPNIRGWLTKLESRPSYELSHKAWDHIVPQILALNGGSKGSPEWIADTCEKVIG